MEKQIKALLIELKGENDDRTTAMNDENCSKYSYSALAHTYNNTLDIIKRLEKIIKAS